MTVSHQVIASWLERAQRHHDDQVRAAAAQLQAARAAAQRQCGAEPGHVFVADAGSETQDRPPMHCVICGIARRHVTGATPNVPPREIDDEALPRDRDAQFRRHVAQCVRRW